MDVIPFDNLDSIISHVVHYVKTAIQIVQNAALLDQINVPNVLILTLMYLLLPVHVYVMLDSLMLMIMMKVVLN